MMLSSRCRQLVCWGCLLVLVLGLGAQEDPALYVREESFAATAHGARLRLQAHWQRTGFRPLVNGLVRKTTPPRRIKTDVGRAAMLVLAAQHNAPNTYMPVIWGNAVLVDKQGRAMPLSRLAPARVTGRGFARFDGKPLRVREQTFANGIVAQAPVEVCYQLDSKYQTFEATVAVADNTDYGYSVRFKVLDTPNGKDLCEEVWGLLAKDFPAETAEFLSDGSYWLAAPHPEWLEGRLTERVVGALGELGRGLAEQRGALLEAKPGPDDPRRLVLLERAVRYKQALALLKRVDTAAIRRYLQDGPDGGLAARCDSLETELASLRGSLAAANDETLVRVAPVVERGQALLREALIPVLGAEEIVFTVREPGRDGHWYANLGYWCSDPDRKVYGPGGSRLAKLQLRTGEVVDLLADPGGAFRDPQVHYDGAKLLFCYRRGGTEHYKLHEANVDGSGVRQLLDDPYDDIEPSYLPDGDILFCSSRCNRWVNCFHTQVATLYRCDPDGGNLRPLSANVEHDNTPWVLPDGRVLFTRWEYVDRSQMAFHHLWTINPDGTSQMVYFGNQRPGRVFIDAKPIPGTDRIVASFCPGHGRREHAGAITVVTPKRGPNEPASERCINSNPVFRDPYPIAEDLFLVACDRRLLVMDGAGATQELYRAERDLHEPRPIRSRPREHRIPPRTDWSQTHGTLVLQDVYAGRNMAGVKRGEIVQLLVLETLPKPVNHSGGMDMTSDTGTFTLERTLGTVPVAADGSAHFLLPANRPFLFVALDRDGLSVKRMQSFVSVLPGETTSCLGCHEPRTRAPALPGRPAVLAATRDADRVQGFAGVPQVIDYPRHVQPILDAHCVKCHNYGNRKGGVVLVGDYGARRGTRRFNQSYWTLLLRGQVADGGNAYGNRAPRTIGSGASPLVAKIREGHHGVRMSEAEYRTVWCWVETGAPYAGTYAALLTTTGPTTGREAKAVIGRRCASCHNRPGMKLPTDTYGVRPHHYRAVPEGAEKFATPLIFNESRPELSMALLAPLAKEAGGYGICPGPVFRSKDDPDYQRMLKALLPPGEYLKTAVLCHMPGFRPNEHYLREMKRYGILPASFDDARDPISVFAVEGAYWRSFWHCPDE